jgi:ferredoxin
MDIRELTDTCVHCGFCLPSCPTYQLWGAEADSPRGRIHLLRQVVDGEAEAAAVAPHIDQCLGCLACVPACPSGVKYEEIIEYGRVVVEESRPARDRTVRDAIFALFPYPRRMAALRPALRLGLTPPAVAGRTAAAACLLRLLDEAPARALGEMGDRPLALRRRLRLLHVPLRSLHLSGRGHVAHLLARPVPGWASS